MYCVPIHNYITKPSQTNIKAVSISLISVIRFSGTRFIFLFNENATYDLLRVYFVLVTPRELN